MRNHAHFRVDVRKLEIFRSRKTRRDGRHVVARASASALCLGDRQPPRTLCRSSPHQSSLITRPSSETAHDAPGRRAHRRSGADAAALWNGLDCGPGYSPYIGLLSSHGLLTRPSARAALFCPRNDLGSFSTRF